ncbi:MAG TPA: RNA polymerase sigma factor [Polyangiaceae bacterium]|nr:RNA polymerase sigma factor [Polyangiaceae bacterium]
MTASKRSTVEAADSAGDERPVRATNGAPDVLLMQAAAAGDPAAQRAVVVRLMRRIQRLCKALLRHREDAGDASQASLLAILRAAGGFRGESSLERWADRIAVRTALRQSRERRREALQPVDENALPAVHSSGDPAIAAGQYLDLLPERQRSVLILRCGFEYSVEEIAELMQTSPNTVKDRLKRARAGVRRALGREETLRLAAGQRR